MLEQIRSLYDYNTWANTRVLDAASRLTPEQFLEPLAGAGSLRDILAHTGGAEWIWFQRCLGHSPRSFWNPDDFPDVATLRQRWDETMAISSDFIAGLHEADLDRIVAYTNAREEDWAYPLWEALLHQANHATQHRSEAAILLTRCGQSPGDLDYLIYLDGLRGRDRR
ncbi:MAG: DinB family protein [Thermomicrobiales bacterium]